MSIAAQLRKPIPARHATRDVISTQIDPADDARNPLMIAGDLQEEISLGFVRTSLYGNTSIDAVVEKQGLEVLWQIVPLQHLHAVGHPRVIFAPVTPEVLMRVDSHV